MFATCKKKYSIIQTLLEENSYFFNINTHRTTINRRPPRPWPSSDAPLIGHKFNAPSSKITVWPWTFLVCFLYSVFQKEWYSQKIFFEKYETCS